MSHISKLVKTSQQWKTHSVKSNDTLSQIALTYYKDWKKWPLIWSANRGAIPDPDILKAGITLTIPKDRELTEQEKQKLQENSRKWEQKKQQKQVPEIQSQEVIEQYELVDLTQYGVPVKDHSSKYCHPNLARAMITLNNECILTYVSEAFPPTGTHNSQAHKNGNAIDFTLKDPSMSEEVCKWLKEKGFKCLNEYLYDSEHKTGDHIHLQI